MLSRRAEDELMVAPSLRGLMVDAAHALIRERRSIRRYRPVPVPDDVVRRVLEAARFAPSAHNRQPWRFAVLTRREPKERLARAMGARLREDRRADGDPDDRIDRDVARSFARITGAPVVVVVCLTLADMDRYPDRRRAAAEHLMAVQGTAMAVQNLLLAAHAEGLGACWMCAPLFCPEVVAQALGLPPDWQPQALVTLGFRADAGKVRPRRPIAELLLPEPEA
jgi:coenzyme F420-0:L-glutamate ligase / coenzyme F420-1:gamma-L-glutamate ligase